MTMTLERPGEAAESFAANLATQERARQTSLLTLARLRKEASAEIDRLIAFLDASDPYMMTELEPSIGGDDREDDDEREHDDPAEDDGTAEPSLGSLEKHPSVFGFGSRDRDGDQTKWGASNRTDLEDDNDSGIGDQDGLDEQVPFRDWQNVGMV